MWNDLPAKIKLASSLAVLKCLLNYSWFSFLPFPILGCICVIRFLALFKAMC